MLFANWGAVARDAQIEGKLSSVKAGGLGRKRLPFLLQNENSVAHLSVARRKCLRL